jgi:hypothetical protein
MGHSGLPSIDLAARVKGVRGEVHTSKPVNDPADGEWWRDPTP